MKIRTCLKVIVVLGGMMLSMPCLGQPHTLTVSNAYSETVVAPVQPIAGPVPIASPDAPRGICTTDVDGDGRHYPSR